VTLSHSVYKQIANEIIHWNEVLIGLLLVMNPQQRFTNNQQVGKPRNRLFIAMLVIFFLLVGVGLLYKPADSRQRQDITQIAAFLQQAYDENTGDVSVSPGPKTNQLNICTNNCSHINYTANLSYYTNKGISIHTYVNNLAVSNANIAYIVNNVDCNGSFNGLGVYGVTHNGNPAQAILYATTSNDKLTQHCENVFGSNPSGQ